MALPVTQTGGCTLETFREDGSLLRREWWPEGATPLETEPVHDSQFYVWGALRQASTQPWGYEVFSAAGTRERAARYVREEGRDLSRELSFPGGLGRHQWQWEGERLVRELESWPEQPASERRYHYAPDGRLTGVDYVFGGELRYVAMPTYAPESSRLTAWVRQEPVEDGFLVDALHFGYRDDGTLAQESYRYYGPGGAWTVTYDAAGRLERAEGSGNGESGFSHAFTYDASGRLLSEAHAFEGALARYAGTVSFRYDVQGQLMREERQQRYEGYFPERIDERRSVRTYRYDEAGRLMEALEDTTGDEAPEGRLSVRYDTTGRPVEEQREGSLLAGTGPRRLYTGRCSGPTTQPLLPAWKSLP